jgi:hypothetical protein
MLFSVAIIALSFMPIISARGINVHVTYQETSLAFMRAGEPGRRWDKNQFTALVSMHVPEQIPLQLLLLLNY